MWLFQQLQKMSVSPQKVGYSDQNARSLTPSISSRLSALVQNHTVPLLDAVLHFLLICIRFAILALCSHCSSSLLCSFRPFVVPNLTLDGSTFRWPSFNLVARSFALLTAWILLFPPFDSYGCAWSQSETWVVEWRESPGTELFGSIFRPCSYETLHSKLGSDFRSNFLPWM
jgi:hypothetical protein